jgi:predicted 3-demethylubiquinone-9 3-methyltransferase (glyoxalase superfamily)
MAKISHRITPFLWFDHQAEEAAKLYVSVFPNSKIHQVSRYTEAGPGKPGSVMVVHFEIDGQPLLALNGGPHFKLTEAFSLSVQCETQQEIDRLWSTLSEGGATSQCGWLKDRFGLSWQIVPDLVPAMMADTDEKRRTRVMQAVYKMTKLDIAALKKAWEG